MANLEFTKDELKFLGQFEDNFTRAIEADYVRGAALSDLDRMAEIWKRVTENKDFHLNKSCGHCILAFFKQIGAEYRKQKGAKKTTTNGSKK